MSDAKATAWTAERDEVLRAAWAAGKTAVQIAEELGGFDHLANGGKNAVVGRAHRLGLKKPRPVMTPEELAAHRVAQSKKANDRRRARRRAKTGVSRESRQHRPSTAAPVSADPAWTFDIPFNDLRDYSGYRPNQCRYPDPNDNVGPNYMCCGAETEPGESYCGHCAEICRARAPVSVALTEEQREKRRAHGRALGFSNIRAGRSYGRSFTPSMVPVVDGEAIV